MIRQAAAVVVALCLSTSPLYAQNTRLTVSDASANVHKAPSVGSPVIGKAPRGTALVVTREVGDWVKVSWPSAVDGAGYVRVSALTAGNAPAAAGSKAAAAQAPAPVGSKAAVTPTATPAPVATSTQLPGTRPSAPTTAILFSLAPKKGPSQTLTGVPCDCQVAPLSLLTSNPLVVPR